MSNYFEEFPLVDYKFGEEDTTTKFQHLGTYVDILDQVKDYSVYYETYAIQNGERPEQLSYKLYRDVNHYWTFFLLNDHLRQTGWPIRDADVYPKVQEYYPHTVLAVNGVAQTYDSKIAPDGSTVWTPNQDQISFAQTTFFVEGAYLFFPFSKTAGKIKKVDQQHGFITCDVRDIRSVDDACYVVPEEEALKVIADPDYVPVILYAAMEVNKVWDEFDAPHHYEDTSGNWIYPKYSATHPYPYDHNKLIGWDNNPSSETYRTWQVVSTEPTVNSVSNFERIREINDEQKLISVIKRDSIVKITSEFRRLLRNER